MYVREQLLTQIKQDLLTRLTQHPDAHVSRNGVHKLKDQPKNGNPADYGQVSAGDPLIHGCAQEVRFRQAEHTPNDHDDRGQ